MKRKRSFWKTQTQWVRIPAMIEAHCDDETVVVRLWPDRPATERCKEPAMIFLTPHETQAFASWLSEQAEALMAKKARAAARKASRAAAKEAKQ